MNYNEFKKTVQKMPVIFSRDLLLNQSYKQNILNQINRWQERNLLIKLKRGVYLLNESDRKITPPKAYIANQLYYPSYISCEYALNFYNLIPELVRDVTSITTRKTYKIRNKLGVFVYQHIKVSGFRGFKLLKDNTGLSFFIAEPEKAIVDFCYLNLDKLKGNYKVILKESYRLQNLETLKIKKIMVYAKIFNNDKLMQVAGSLCGLITEERKANK